MDGMTTAAPAWNTSTRIDAVDLTGRSIAIVAHGGGSRRLSAHYMVVDTAAARPIVGEWPYTPAGLRAARRAYTAAVASV